MHLTKPLVFWAERDLMEDQWPLDYVAVHFPATVLDVRGACLYYYACALPHPRLSPLTGQGLLIPHLLPPHASFSRTVLLSQDPPNHGYVCVHVLLAL